MKAKPIECTTETNLDGAQRTKTLGGGRRRRETVQTVSLLRSLKLSFAKVSSVGRQEEEEEEEKEDRLYMPEVMR